MRAALVLLLLVVLAGCGGGGGEERVGPVERKPDADAERVVRAWADTLRGGDVAGAARYFALPSTVANGFPPVRLTTRAAAEQFNRTLSCGAVVIGTEASAHGFLIVTVRLTERPGAGECGSGTGGTARTAVLVRDGKIAEWLRMPGGEQPDAELVPA